MLKSLFETLAVAAHLCKMKPKEVIGSSLEVGINCWSGQLGRFVAVAVAFDEKLANGTTFGEGQDGAR